MQVLVFFGLLVGTICHASEFDFTLEVLPSKKECFYQTIKQGSSVDVEYQVGMLAFGIII